jgi:hypothetical protein
VRRANLALLLVSAAAVTATFPLRALRWRVLVAGPGGAVLPYRPLWRAVAIGFMANNVLPARAGELVRGYAGAALTGLPFSTLLASIAVERVFDGIVIVLLLALALGAPGSSGAMVIGTTSLDVLAASMAALFVGALVFLVLLARNQARVLPLAERLLQRALPGRASALAVRVLDNVAAGLGVLHSTRDVLRVVVWSFAVWLVNAGSFVIAFLAFGLHVPAASALVLQGVVAFGVAIPSTPGFFGVYEALTRAVLGAYGVPGEQAVSFAIGVHLCWFVPITAIGLAVLARTGLTLRALRAGAAA